MGFIKGWITKIAAIAILIGIGGTLLGLWSIFQERSVGTEATAFDVSALPADDNLVLATVSGGYPDVFNSYEYALEGRSGSSISSEYFIPVLQNEGGALAYVLRTRDENFQFGSEVTGLLKSASDLPSDIAEEFAAIYPETGFKVLDADYEAETFVQKLIGIAIFPAIAAGGAVLVLLGGREKRGKSAAQMPAETFAGTAQH